MIQGRDISNQKGLYLVTAAILDGVLDSGVRYWYY